jgi:transcriptional regulator with XRE-family HTH domain
MSRMKTYTDELGSALRSLRRQAGISQEEMASRSGLHRTYVGSVERGERNITVASLQKLAIGLDTAGSDILREAEELRSERPEPNGSA